MPFLICFEAGGGAHENEGLYVHDHGYGPAQHLRYLCEGCLREDKSDPGGHLDGRICGHDKDGGFDANPHRPSRSVVPGRGGPQSAQRLA